MEDRERERRERRERWLDALLIGACVALIVALVALPAWGAYAEQKSTAQEEMLKQARWDVTQEVEKAHAEGKAAPPPVEGTAIKRLFDLEERLGVTPEPAPGTTTDVELEAVEWHPWFNGREEWVRESLQFRNITDHDLTSVWIPLLPGAQVAYLSSFNFNNNPPVPKDAKRLTIQGGWVEVPMTVPAQRTIEDLATKNPVVHLVMRVSPLIWHRNVTWTVPTFLIGDIDIAYGGTRSFSGKIKSAYKVVGGTKDQSFVLTKEDPNTSIVWYLYGPFPEGTKVTWTMVEKDPTDTDLWWTPPPLPKVCNADPKTGEPEPGCKSGT